MTAINHSMTGAVIGFAVGNPILAIPAAIASHFVCDALPHYSSDRPKEEVLKTNRFRNYLIAEAGLCFLLVVVLAVLHPHDWLLAAVCAFMAASPDFLWINQYVKARKGKKWSPGLYAKFAQDIQWFARPIGAAVEAVWFIGFTILLLPFLT